jgi:hypothetical protein
VFDALRELMTPPELPSPPKRPIGFITSDDQPKSKASKGLKAMKTKQKK